MTDKQDLYKEAMKFAKEKASISYVQRKCRCSYNDAERMLEQMVSEDVIGTYNGRKGGEAVGAGGVQALSAAPALDERVPEAWTNLLAYVLQDDMRNRLTPRVIDIAYTAFNLAKQPNSEDGGASDWLNDTKPAVAKMIAKLRKDLIEDRAASPTPPAEQAAPKAAPGEQNTVPAEWLEQAYREGWAACRDAETIGEEAEDWAFGNSKANSRMIDAQQAAPQQEAPKAAPGEPVKQTVREQIAAEVATQPAAQVEFLARYLCERDSINPDQMLDDNPVRLAWHREDLNAARLLAKLAELAPQQEAQEPIGWTTGITWRPNSRLQSEQVIKITRDAQPNYGYTTPIYTAPQPAPAPLSEQAEEAAMYRWLRAQHEDDSGELRCCVYAPNDMLECLVPVGDMPGELDAFIRAALAAQGEKDAG